jgi:hypothetical protein
LKLKVGLYQISKVRESFLRESCEVLQQSFGKPLEEFSDLNRPFEDLIQASGLRFEALWDDADVDTDSNGQVHILALLHNAWQDTTNLLPILEDVVYLFHRWSLRATLLFSQFFDDLESGHSGKLRRELAD